MDKIVSTSVLTVKKDALVPTLKVIEEGGSKYLHFDVMDGVFVPNVSYSLGEFKNAKKYHNMVNDVHIMVQEPLYWGRKFAEFGADYVTFHLEACKTKEYLFETINVIRKNGSKVGISIKPNTPVEDVFPVLSHFDLLLIMSVEPGFGGQKFNPIAVEKIAKAKKYIEDNNLNVLIEVDGGINDQTSILCKEAGVDILVAGTYIVGSDDIKSRIHSLL